MGKKFTEDGFEILGDGDGDGVTVGEVLGATIVGVDPEGRLILDNDKLLAGPRVAVPSEER